VKEDDPARHRLDPEYYDLGGGLGIPYRHGADPAPSFSDYAAAVVPVFAAGVKKAGSPLSSASSDIAVIVGGDGTILRTVQRLGHQIPLIGINWGEVGFLADLEPDEVMAFFSTIKSGFNIERRMRITISSENEVLGTALNETLIVTSRPAKMLRFSILVDQMSAGTFRADGLLISTPTGSTAYAMSAGGPIIDPRIEGFLLVPLAPYMLSSRPLLVSCERPLEIRLESNKPATLVIDGQRSWDLTERAVLTIERSPEPALFVDVGKKFFKKVDNVFYDFSVSDLFPAGRTKVYGTSQSTSFQMEMSGCHEIV
jgi:NAD+ kinase